MSKSNKTLFVHPRRGLFQVTKCSDCGYTFGCQRCDAKLVAYRQGFGKLSFVCHQCQSHYKFPDYCPSCNSKDLFSFSGGVEELAEVIQNEFKLKPIRLDLGEDFYSLGGSSSFPQLKESAKQDEKILNQVQNDNVGIQNDNVGIQNDNWGVQNDNKIQTTNSVQIGVTTRVFDPSIDYSSLDSIIFVQAQNLLASPDYLVQEEISKSLAELFLRVDRDKTEIIFDSNSTDIEFFENISRLNKDHSKKQNIMDWYLRFLQTEANQRSVFGFPPFQNLILLTTQEKDYNSSLQKISNLEKELKQEIKNDFEGLKVNSPYPAKFLKRKDKFSHHILLKYPKQYPKFKELRDLIMQIRDRYKVQARLNPRNLF